MLQSRELGTIRAALQSWQEEICPHGPEVARPYLDVEGLLPLAAKEVERLRAQFQAASVRYALIVEDGEELASPRLFPDAESARQAGGTAGATVLMPTSG